MKPCPGIPFQHYKINFFYVGLLLKHQFIFITVCFLFIGIAFVNCNMIDDIE